ncbi:MAG: hypothetical protein CVV25_03480 [Ignavibacteriae bacterium HGW-Ignavibacteriae-4]|jgi:heptosyltransferase-2|nr:MAG: hypothetical protein CVV25_03480 [Ignavibacteriae bacterium HGW-Ignavibacteriae-4]
MSTKYNLKKILIIRISSIGDVVLSTHLPRLIKNKYPDAIVHLVTNKGIALLLSKLESIDKVISIDSENRDSLANEIIESEYDVILDLQKNSISAKLIAEYKGDLRVINKFRKQKLEMVYLKKFPEETVHVGERYLDTCRDLIEDDGLGLDLGFEVYTNNNKIIGIAPEAFHKTKRWQQEKYEELIDRLIKDEYEVRIFGSDNSTLVNTNSKAENYCGKLSLVETADKISECDYFICNDTGLMHIASACQIPILAIFGSSVKELGFTPFRVKHEIIEHDIWCRPCSHIGRAFCPLGHFKCMKEITVDEVYNRFNKFKEKQLETL